MKKVLLEGLLVAMIGAGLAFAANALSPRGLKLTRNFFPTSKDIAARPQPGASAGQSATGTNQGTTADALETRLAAQGLQLAGSNQVMHLFQEPRYQQDLVVFIDARDDEHYKGGHIPGAYELEYYHPEAYLPSVVPLCQVAQQVVVYCEGGNCEDSEHAALLLRTAGVAATKLYVYAGGMTEWSANHWPIEVGPRKSGQMRQGQ